MAGEFFYHYTTEVLDKKAVQEAELKKGRSLKAFIFMLIVTSSFGVLLFRLADLQLVRGKIFKEQAQENRIRKLPIPASRGYIFDRNGKPLAASRLSHSLYLWPRGQTEKEWPALTAQLSSILKIPANKITEKLAQAGYKSPIPVKIAQNLLPNQVIALQENASNEKLRGVELRSEFNRYYPQGKIASHILGYVGEATLEEVKANKNYPMGMILGKMGIERSSNLLLEGAWGERWLEIDANGQELKDLGAKKQPIAGKAVKLTLDVDMQKAAEKALAGRQGAAVALNVKTGEILVMASAPTFDPNIFTGKLTKSSWASLQAEDKPFLNRAVQGYPAGSTFKIVTSMAALQSGRFSPNSILYAPAAIYVGGISFHEHQDHVYGYIGFRDALAVSSNTFFYQLGIATGPENISKWAHALGVGGTINLDLLGIDGANHGQVPTPADKLKMYKEDWYAGDTVTMAIGQGLVLVTPLELATVVSSIANGGYRVQPHLLRSLTNKPQTKPTKIGLAPENLKVVKEGLIEVVLRGTGRSLNDGSIPLTGGKTGTVQIPGQKDNAMYVGFGPADKPEIAIAVAVEQGGYGAVSAAPIAHEIFKIYFANKSKAVKMKSQLTTNN